MLNTMVSDREIIPIGEAAAMLCNDTTMNGSNGPASPIVVEPSDREGLTTGMPERGFFMYAPQFHWTMARGPKDRRAPFAVENIAHK